MRFEWDEDKRRTKIRKHRIDFVVVEEVFAVISVRKASRNEEETYFKEITD